MKKITLLPLMLCMYALQAKSQLQTSKLLGKGSEKYGIGAGIMATIDIPTARENQSIRIELVDFGYHPQKGEGFFTAEEGKGYISFRVGYKYVFSETGQGFYVLPTAGAANVLVSVPGETEMKSAWGFTSALETGYGIYVGERGNMLSLGLKYEQAFIKAPNDLKVLALRIGYSTGLFRSW